MERRAGEVIVFNWYLIRGPQIHSASSSSGTKECHQHAPANPDISRIVCDCQGLLVPKSSFSPKSGCYAQTESYCNRRGTDHSNIITFTSWHYASIGITFVFQTYISFSGHYVYGLTQLFSQRTRLRSPACDLLCSHSRPWKKGKAFFIFS
jgi:hypothetical protein